MTQQPQAKYRHDYRAPDYQITDIDLTFDLDAEKTVVTAVSQVVRHGASDAPLRLNGEDLTLVSIHVNDELWTEYKEEEGALVINQLPERFTLRIVNEISPAANTALEGLYKSGDALCTQCEAEGFRHITWYLDRPDVLARFTTKIIADKTQYQRPRHGYGQEILLRISRGRSHQNSAHDHVAGCTIRHAGPCVRRSF